MPGQRIWMLTLLRHAHFVMLVRTVVKDEQNARIAMLVNSIMTGPQLLRVSHVLVGNSLLVDLVTMAQYVPIV
jgi:hypothetical protein